MKSLLTKSVIYLFVATIATASSVNDEKGLRNFQRVDICTHGGVLRNGRCECPLKWIGTTCEEERCKNGGRAIRNSNGTVTCACPFGLDGLRCDKVTKCDNGRLVQGVCECERGFVGLFCQSRPCHQGMPVILPGQNEYTCVCDIGFTGPFCKEEFVCLNGGRISAQNKCECRGGHAGTLCDEKLDCVNGNFTRDHNDCICINGFTGVACNKCEHIVKNGKCAPEVSEMSQIPFLEWTTIAVAGSILVVLIVVIIVVYFVLRRWCSKPSRVSSQPSRISTAKTVSTAANMAPVPTEV
ncbi:hypothetical protein PRIPAC_90028 [Pristionchus pacificus]|uniref:Uncharacterized protein n=1 Tax=Pristionchus pacificus TaxID=54126 RepID=A0A2A6CXW8_PRIPA|nr:hypothetical protein PRIPAC_90028 [Pristionchus pacificus]|eukprot:PDM82950.1 hypothetical protein PRIPAC_37343 [Pristionchus pacificus]